MQSFEEAANVIGNDALYELKKLVDIYDEKMYIWLSGLWEPEIGGFYYSSSARDNDGFLPDLESTGQALQFIHDSGLCPDYKDIPENFKMQMISFARGLQSVDDGFFYHPQWGKDIPTSRRGRDLAWASGILNKLGADMKYPSPLDAGVGEQKPKRAEHLSSPKAFKKYISEFEDPSSAYYIHKHSYPLGNLIASQAMQIKAAGEEYVKLICDFFSRHQYEHNGLWEENVDYDPINGLMKIGTVYSMLGEKMPNAELALESALDVALRPYGETHICCIYNPLQAAASAIKNVKQSLGQEGCRNIRNKIYSVAFELISVTREKTLRFKKTDGSFSMRHNRSADRSQGVSVAVPNTNEGDVNSTKISVSAILGLTCEVLGINRIPVFTEDDGKLFFELMDNSKHNTRKGKAI
ncbi:MAG: hypothetical protein J6B48_07790 [Clostridia bacterium]|nr:hypothetical protein [Clostridia bacterium]